MKLLRNNIVGFIFIFSYACFLLSLPNFGPVSLKIIELRNVDPYIYFSLFYIFHISGIASSAFFLDKIENRIKLAKIITLLIIVFSFLLPYDYRFIAPIGFLMGILIVIIGSFIARFVEPWKRGRIFAFGASLSNIYFFYFFYYKILENLKMLIFLSILPFVLFYILPSVNFEKRQSNINRSFINFAIPIFVFYMLGGLMYGIMEPAFREKGISVHVLFYASAIILAGYLYDAVGRRIVSILGLLMLSASFLIFPENLLLSAYLIQLSYAFIDVFAMIIWTDISNFGSEARQYSLGMLFITTPIFLGFVITKFISFHLNTLLAIMLLILSAFIIGTTKEPIISPKDYIRWISRR